VPVEAVSLPNESYVFLAEDLFFSIFPPLSPRLLEAGVIPAVLPVKGLR
jgi:hypothetical protein